jgi:hypothetical protein
MTSSPILVPPLKTFALGVNFLYMNFGNILKPYQCGSLACLINVKLGDI